jgi:hypothetical protein
MNIDLLNKLFSDLKQDDLSYAYTGSFSDTLTVRMIDLARYKIESKGLNAGLKNKVSFLMGECYQNIVRHGIISSETNKFQEKSNFLFLRIIGNNYYITSANPVQNQSIPAIKSKLDRINSLSQDELKELQKQILSKGELNEKGGAGIGIILMARKTEQKLAYRFVKLNDDLSIFYLQVKLQEEGVDKEENSINVSIDQTINLHDSLVSQGILLMHKGDFSKETFLPVIKMIEGNFANKFENSFISTKLYHLLVEILQNISKHGFKKDGVNNGIFTVGCFDEHFAIGSANYIENSKVEFLRKRLDDLRKLSQLEYDKLYKEKLKLVIEQSDENIGLGLIDIFRYSKSLEYRLENQAENYLFSFVATIK